MNRSRTDYWTALVHSFRAQTRNGGVPNFSAAGTDAGCDRRTARRCWDHPQPAVERKHGPLPAIKDLIAAERMPASPVSAPAVGREPGPVPAVPTAPAALEPARAEPEPSVIALEPDTRPAAPPVSAAPPLANPATLIVAPVDPVEVVRSRAAAAIGAEMDVLASARNLSLGLMVTGTKVVQLIFDAEAELRANLRQLMIEKPREAVSLLADLAKICDAATRSAQRVIEANRVVAGLPTAITEHRAVSSHHQEPERLDDAEIRRRAIVPR
jgi:hypothetical protein